MTVTSVLVLRIQYVFHRLDTCLGGLAVPYLTDHHHVGITTQDAPEPGREGQADPGIDLDLVDTAYPVLHGVLDGDYVLLGGVDLAQGGVERRRLAAAGRARHEYRPVGSPEDRLVPVEHPPGEPETSKVGAKVRVVEQAKNDLFAERGR